MKEHVRAFFRRIVRRKWILLLCAVLLLLIFDARVTRVYRFDLPLAAGEAEEVIRGCVGYRIGVRLERGTVSGGGICTLRTREDAEKFIRELAPYSGRDSRLTQLRLTGVRWWQFPPGIRGWTEFSIRPSAPLWLRQAVFSVCTFLGRIASKL